MDEVWDDGEPDPRPLKLVATNAEMRIAMAPNGSDPAPLADRRAPAATIAYTPRESKVRLPRSGRIVSRFWRRSQAEKTALAYREAGYVAGVSEEPRGRSVRKWAPYAVVISEKIR